MKMFLVSLGSLLPALVLGGCMGTENRGVESVHQAVVTRSDYALDLATAGKALAPGEQQRLAGWMTALHVGYGDHIAIDDGGTSATVVHKQVGALIAHYGLFLADDAPTSAAPLAPGTVRIIISRMKATVSGCPDWSRDSSHDFNSNTSSNYGCATNATLAAMIARPEDLIHGQSSGPTSDPAISSKAIGSFRKAPATGSQGLKSEKVGGQ